MSNLYQRLAYCLSINKGQGQENERVGIYLPSPVFSHGDFFVCITSIIDYHDLESLIYIFNSGQLYTAFGRGKREKNVKVYTENEDGLTNNIVYKELLN